MTPPSKSWIHNEQKAFSVILFMTVFIAGILYGEISSAEDFYPYITTTIPIAGYVKKLIIPNKTPNLLFALVQTDGKLKPTDKTGLYVFDISEAARPKQISYLPVEWPVGIELHPNGTTLFLYSEYGIKLLNVSGHNVISEVGKIELGISHARLSLDGKLLFIKEKGLLVKDEEDYSFTIFSIPSTIKPVLLTRVKRRWSNVFGFFPMQDNKHLMISGGTGKFVSYDITNPSDPKEETYIEHDLGFPLEIGNNGMVYLLDEMDLRYDRDLVLATLIPQLKKTGALRIRSSGIEVRYISDDNKTIYLSTIDKSIYKVDLVNPKSPKLTMQYRMPNYVGAVSPAHSNRLIYAGLSGSIVIIDPAKTIVTSKLLTNAHAEALRQYKRTDLKFDFERIDNAVNILEAAGIRTALAKKPSGLSDKGFAGILNDYGFFLMKRQQNEEAAEIYKKVINIDPLRTIAYLNLGDSLRERLPHAESFKEKIVLTKEIKAAYNRYKKLSGRSSPTIDSFLALNIVDTSITDVCEYIGAYTNDGRLRELFGSGRSVAKNNGKGSMQVKISYEGTAHFPYVRFIDNETNAEIEELIPDNGKDAPWADIINIVPFSDGHHLLYYNSDYHLVISTPIGAARESGKSCRFNVQVTESFDMNKPDAALCRLVQSSDRPGYIEFEESASLDEETLNAAGYFWTFEFKAGDVDFDNDGNPDKLAHLKYQSGAGPGCSYDFFELLNEEDDFSTSKKRSLLLEMQRIEKHANRLHPVPFCRGNTTGWFRYNGITYFETKYPEEQPQSSAQEFHIVSYIKDGQINKVCEGTFKQDVQH